MQAGELRVAKSQRQEALFVDNWSRRRWETVALTVLPLLGLWLSRSQFESRLLLTFEVVAVVSCALGLALVRRFALPQSLGMAVGCILPGAALCQGVWGRIVSSEPPANELILLAIFCGGAVWLAMAGRDRRAVSTALVASGFACLFVVFSCAHPLLLPLTLMWFVGCLWHLVANHWEHLEASMPAKVRRGAMVRPASVVTAVGLCAIGAVIAHGRMGDSNRFEWGFMPTSGGSSWSDPSSREGVGMGDAAVAAKEHATSFGAVDTDVFLESEESSLFDMFSDTIGEPFVSKVKEKRQALLGTPLSETHGEVAETEKSSSQFAVSRTAPKLPDPHATDVRSNDILQWVGRVGVRLGLQRYEEFDGQAWSALPTSQHHRSSLRLAQLEDQHWFVDHTIFSGGLRDLADCEVGSVRVMRPEGNRLAAPWNAVAVHVREVERDDFFARDLDSTWVMPGREKVPSLTVAHFLLSNIREDELLTPDAYAKDKEPSETTTVTLGMQQARALARKLTEDETLPHDKVRRIIKHLRDDYVFDRQAASDHIDPLAVFLDAHRGGDHLFATCAVVMLHSIGIDARLVTGYYVNPQHYDIGGGFTAIRKDDAHVWVEAKLADGRWLPLEPTPGYLEPDFRPSLLLTARRMAIAYWYLLPLGCGIVVLLWCSGRQLIEYGLRIIWLIDPRRHVESRMALAVKIVECRAKLARCPRCQGATQRDWLIKLASGDQTIESLVEQYCVAAEHVFFGGCHPPENWRQVTDLLVRKMNIAFIRSRSQLSGL